MPVCRSLLWWSYGPRSIPHELNLSHQRSRDVFSSWPTMTRIYPSTVPSVPVVTENIYTHLFHTDAKQPGLVGGFSGTAPAFIDARSGATLTRRHLYELTSSLAYSLRTHPFFEDGSTLKRGDTVLIYSPNSLAYPIIVYAATCAGLRVTLANSAYTAEELLYQLKDSCARVVFAHPTLFPVVHQMNVPGLPVVSMGVEWLTGTADGGITVPLSVASLIEEAQGKSFPAEVFSGKDVHETVYLCYSSGTTGRPKGVETTHANVCTVLSIIHPVFPAIKHGEDVMLGKLPFYHIYGGILLLHYCFWRGVPTVILPRFDPDAFCRTIARYRCTACLTVPPVFVVLARHQAILEHDISSLRWLMTGAAPIGIDLIEAVKSRLQTVGCSIAVVQSYGLTETSPTTHVQPIADAERKVGTCGILLPNLEVRIVGDDEKDTETGELWIRGATVMKGYLNNPVATADVITPDGWFKTGDIGRRDEDGFYYIVDRKKELIKYKGFQVPPAELEDVLLTHPNIADAAVIGVESRSEATELPRAYIVLDITKGPITDDPVAFGKGVQKWMESKVARHKYLRGGVVAIDAIPKSAAGKILRRQLRERAKAELEETDIHKAKL